MSRYRGPRFKKIRRLGALPGLTNKRPRAGSDLRNQSRSGKKSQYRIRWAEFYGRERCNNNLAMSSFFKYCKRKSLLIEPGREAVLVIGSERGLARKLAPLKSHYLIRICYARYADDLPLGIVGAVELLIEIQKRIAHFLQSGLNLWVGSAGSTTIAARSTIEFLGTVIREVPPRTLFALPWNRFTQKDY